MVRSFDPFMYQNMFHEYELDITHGEINLVYSLLKDLTLNNLEQKTSYKDTNILDIHGLFNLKQQIINILKSHNLRLDNNWAQLYNKDNEHKVHNHPFSIYSGIVYLEPKEASPTIFYDRDFRTYKHTFKKNQLLLFPSYIPHEVSKLNKDEKRLIISFNTDEGN